MDLNTPKRLFLRILFFLFFGVITGITGASFALATRFVTNYRLSHGWLLFLLPFGGIIIYKAYKELHDGIDKGTNLIVRSMNMGDDIPIIMFPLIFFSATLSHLIGASVGGEGSTIQLGGSLASYLAKKYKLEKDERNLLITCGVAGVFSGMFGAPVCAAIFSVELPKVLKPNLKALIPALVTSFIARKTGTLMGVANADFNIGIVPDFSAYNLGVCALIGIAGGLMALLYVFSISYLRNTLAMLIPHFKIRAVVFGGVILILSFVFKGQIYNGFGAPSILLAYSGQAVIYACLIKILFTTLSFVAGYKGGEVYPAFFIGSTLGASLGNLIGFFPGFAAGLGVGAVFSAITNCPLAALALTIEFYGGKGAVFFLIAVIIGFIVSGKRSIFPAQEYPFLSILSSKNPVE